MGATGSLLLKDNGRVKTANRIFSAAKRSITARLIVSCAAMQAL